jgi:hypothetical protein
MKYWGKKYMRFNKNNYEAIEREPQRNIILGDLFIDRSCWKKTKHQKELLKVAKWNSKDG